MQINVTRGDEEIQITDANGSDPIVEVINKIKAEGSIPLEVEEAQNVLSFVGADMDTRSADSIL